MSGIGGIVTTDGPVARRQLENMVGLLRHRGADDTGMFIDSNIHLVTLDWAQSMF